MNTYAINALCHRRDECDNLKRIETFTVQAHTPQEAVKRLPFTFEPQWVFDRVTNCKTIYEET